MPLRGGADLDTEPLGPARLGRRRPGDTASPLAARTMAACHRGTGRPGGGGLRGGARTGLVVRCGRCRRRWGRHHRPARRCARPDRIHRAGSSYGHRRRVRCGLASVGGRGRPGRGRTGDRRCDGASPLRPGPPPAGRPGPDAGLVLLGELVAQRGADRRRAAQGHYGPRGCRHLPRGRSRRLPHRSRGGRPCRRPASARSGSGGRGCVRAARPHLFVRGRRRRRVRCRRRGRLRLAASRAGPPRRVCGGPRLAATPQGPR